MSSWYIWLRKGKPLQIPYLYFFSVYFKTPKQVCFYAMLFFFNKSFFSWAFEKDKKKKTGRPNMLFWTLGSYLEALPSYVSMMSWLWCLHPSSRLLPIMGVQEPCSNSLSDFNQHSANITFTVYEFTQRNRNIEFKQNEVISNKKKKRKKKLIKHCLKKSTIFLHLWWGKNHTL